MKKVLIIIFIPFLSLGQKTIDKKVEFRAEKEYSDAIGTESVKYI